MPPLLTRVNPRARRMAQIGARAPWQAKRAMSDEACVSFLQWALARLDLRWAGFRKVRGQVCKRIKRRLAALGLDSFEAYRARLEADGDEWRVLDSLCHITISRFGRDRGVFETIAAVLLPDVACTAEREGRMVRCWSAGCASGEEPYTLKILWDLEVAPDVPGVAIEIVATDVDAMMIARARAGCFGRGSLHELPDAWLAQAFERQNGRYCVKARHRQGITFMLQDLRAEMPAGPFDMILCRNTAFTYFAPELQVRVLAGIVARLRPGATLVLGKHERLPDAAVGLVPIDSPEPIFSRAQVQPRCPSRIEPCKEKPR
jgi:chemotaxis protein methyltransferase CheR